MLQKCSLVFQVVCLNHICGIFSAIIVFVGIGNTISCTFLLVLCCQECEADATGLELSVMASQSAVLRMNTHSLNRVSFISFLLYSLVRFGVLKYYVTPCLISEIVP